MNSWSFLGFWRRCCQQKLVSFIWPLSLITLEYVLMNSIVETYQPSNVKVNSKTHILMQNVEFF